MQTERAQSFDRSLLNLHTHNENNGRCGYNYVVRRVSEVVVNGRLKTAKKITGEEMRTKQNTNTSTPFELLRSECDVRFGNAFQKSTKQVSGRQ